MHSGKPSAQNAVSLRAMNPEKDADLSTRKADHIELAFASQTAAATRDARFYYEPVLSGHPDPDGDLPTPFLGKTLRFPIWVSSMTGGTVEARNINENLARMCGEFGFGMGLGSCRAVLEHPELLPDFDVRRYIGPDLPLYANLGIAQIEHLLDSGRDDRITYLLDLLQADGLIIHINPLQEWLQPEGDRIRYAPADTIQTLTKRVACSIIVKEVGQGMGPESLSRLLTMPIDAIELAAHGGTNFAALELMREKDSRRQEEYLRLGNLGHSAEEMIAYCNHAVQQFDRDIRCRQVIISGGVRDFLDGFYLMNKLLLPSVYGQASGFLKYARQGYAQLRDFARMQTAGLKLASTYLKVR